MKTYQVLLLIAMSYACSTGDENRISDLRDDNEYTYIETEYSRWMTDDLAYLDEDIYLSGAWIWNCEQKDILHAQDCAHFGKCLLYNWETANNYCPDGWHLPSRKEWMELISFYSEDDLGSPHFNGFNLTFDGHARVMDKFCLFEGNTFWTSDSDLDTQQAYAVAIHRSSEGVIICGFEKSLKHNAFYVRCVEDLD